MSHGGVRAGVTVESCVWEARHHAIRNVFWSWNSKMGSLKLGRGDILDSGKNGVLWLRLW